jgi:hypothetical protein
MTRSTPTRARRARRAPTASAAPALALAALLSVGCDQVPSGPRVPSIAPAADPVPIILVPGAEASTLVTGDGEVLWAAAIGELLDPAAFEQLAQPLTPGVDTAEPLLAADVIRGLPGRDFYGGLIRSLEQRSGGPCVLPRDAVPNSRCVLFPWDWRLDFAAAAARLDDLIERLRHLRGDPALKVDLIGHSAGGIVVRYFVRFGGKDVLGLSPERLRVSFAGVPKVRRAALLAVPNDGSVFGLRAMMQGHRLGLAVLRPELMAVMPSAYQVLPHPERTWLIDADGKPVRRNLYDADTWRSLGQAIFAPEVRARVRARPDGERRLARLDTWFEQALERGRRLQLALGRPVRTPFAYDIFAGDCKPTLARLVEERIGGEPRLRFAPEQIRRPRPGVDYAALMYHPGDGWVTRGSALGRDTGTHPLAFEVRNAVLGCAGHSEMPSVSAVRNTLVGVLALADAEDQKGSARYALRDEVR